MEKGPRIQNTEIAKLFSLRIIGKSNLLLLLQNNYDGFLIHNNKLGEIYAISD